MTTKHTPGPWKERTCYDNGEPCEYAIEGKHPEHQGPIATVHITVDNDEQDYANARLIAAAPELVDLARKLRDAWPHRHESGYMAIVAEATEDARTALAAADID